MPLLPPLTTSNSNSVSPSSDSCSSDRVTQTGPVHSLVWTGALFAQCRRVTSTTVKAALARAVVGDVIAPVAGRHFAAVDFDCAASDFDESRPRSTLVSFVLFHVNCAICVARNAP